MPYYKRKRETELPEWLWFFLLLPIVLIVLLIWKRRIPLPRRRPRYTEPDSIPLRMDTEETSVVGESSPSRAAYNDLPQPDAQPVQQVVESESDEASEPSAPDDLSAVEGIGPAINQLLHRQGISTFDKLAQTPVDRLNQILEEAKLRRLADPGTWPEQARLAAGGKWEELSELQDKLKRGRRENG
jgi:predicted flap endonuclease-1-like 5' DNA nuclease